MALKDLKTYLEKELHARRFLGEALDAVEQIDTLETQTREAKETFKAALAELDALDVKKQQVQDDIRTSELNINVAKAAATKIVTDARAKADDIVAKANSEADNLEAEVGKQLEKERLAVTNLLTDKAALEKEISELQKARSDIDAQLKTLRAKFA